MWGRAATGRQRLLMAGLGVLGGLALLQLVPYGHSHLDPPSRGEPPWDSPQTQALFARTCGDCHSNATVWPWYSNLAPLSWLVERDVTEGRYQLDVSEWPDASGEAFQAAELYSSGRMPPDFYLLLHPEARLAPADRQALIAGLAATFGTERGARRPE